MNEIKISEAVTAISIFFFLKKKLKGFVFVPLHMHKGVGLLANQTTNQPTYSHDLIIF